PYPGPPGDPRAHLPAGLPYRVRGRGPRRGHTRRDLPGGARAARLWGARGLNLASTRLMAKLLQGGKRGRRGGKWVAIVAIVLAPLAVGAAAWLTLRGKDQH